MINYVELDITDLYLLILYYKKGLYPCRDRLRIIRKGICNPFSTCDKYCPFLYEDKIGEYLR